MYRAVNLPKATAPTLSGIEVTDFLGADLTNSPANVGLSFSPDCENMIRDVPGKVRKRMGWSVKKHYNDKINGCYKLTGKTPLIHAGYSLFKDDFEIYIGMRDTIAKSWEFDNKLYIADGFQFLCYDGENVVKVQDNAYIPTVHIALSPKGGDGTSYEQLNLINREFTELFLGTDTDKAFHLSFAPLDGNYELKVESLMANGVWKHCYEHREFSVDTAAGIIHFTAPQKTPIAGQDNVRITAARTVDGYAEKINWCSIGMPFGINGASDRLFLSGNEEYPNYDWFSGLNDPTFWGDVSYSVLGQSDSKIIGYSIINAHLAAHKSSADDRRNVIIRSGSLVGNAPAFRIENILQGEGGIARNTFNYLSSEPVFLTKLGVYAITAQDVTGDKVTSLRSFYVNGKLLQEENLQDAYAFVFKDMYWICINDRVYILDGLQRIDSYKSAPYSTRQCAGFHCSNIPVRVMWEQDDALWFGTKSGDVCAFYKDSKSTSSYNDNGKAISAHWRTPDIAGHTGYRNKTFSRVYVELAAAVATGVKLKSRIDGIWQELFADFHSARYFSYAHIKYSTFTYSNDNIPSTIGEKIKIKNVDKAGFMAVNDLIDQPFGLNGISIEFVESGYYKG